MRDIRSNELTPKRILLLGIPLLLLYLAVGMPDIGRKVIAAVFPGQSAEWIEFGAAYWNFCTAFIILFLIPYNILRNSWEISPEYIGTQKGDIKWGKRFLLISLLAIPLLYYGSNDPTLIQEYPLAKVIVGKWILFIFYEFCYFALYYSSYEFFFRGFLQIGLNLRWKRIYGILLVTIITGLIHIFPMQKPLSEIIGAFLIGPVFGYIAQKTKSWYYVCIIHFFIGFLTDFYSIMHILGYF